MLQQQIRGDHSHKRNQSNQLGNPLKQTTDQRQMVH